MKVVENAGTSLGNLLSNKNPWAGSKCGRTNCHPSRQPSEKVEDCMTQNIVYEFRCNLCNGEEKGKTVTDLTDQRALPYIYVGESSRSLHERSKEHHADYKKNQDHARREDFI